MAGKPNPILGIERDERERVRLISYEVPNRVLEAVPHPVVTVRTITYQHARFIRQCIEGVLMQRTNFPFEYIIGEDCSTDGTRDIVLEYAQAHPERIRVVTADENVGMKWNSYRTKLAGRGKYMVLCDGDDYYSDPLKLQKQVDILEANPQYAGCFHYTTQDMTDLPDRKPRVFGEHGGRTVFGVKDTLAAYAICHNSAFMYRREAQVSQPWTKGIISGDMALNSIVAASGDLVCIPEVMSVYRKHPGGVTEHLSRERELLHHRNRIKLLDHLDAFHGHKYHDHVQEVKGIHQREIDRLQAAARKPGLLHRVLGRVKRMVGW
jgi:glycosyltransferase involved in cell wall biosynthesis